MTSTPETNSFIIRADSPLFQYGPARNNAATGWTTVKTVGLNGPYAYTSAPSATFVLEFFGSAVELLGNHLNPGCNLLIALDGVASPQSQSDGVALARFDNLTMTDHRLTWQSACAGDGGIRVDSAVIRTVVGPAGSSRKTVFVDDSDPSIIYSSEWVTGTKDVVYNKTLHGTNILQASATLDFYGTVISVFGSTYNDHGDFSGAVDGNSTTLSGLSTSDAYLCTLIFFKSGLDPEAPHTLIMTNLGSGLYLQIDHIEIIQIVSPGSDPNPPSIGPLPAAPPPSARPSPAGLATVSPGPNVPAIAAGTVAGVLALISAILIVLLIRRRQRQTPKPAGFMSIDSHANRILPYPHLSEFSYSPPDYTADPGSPLASTRISTRRPEFDLRPGTILDSPAPFPFSHEPEIRKKHPWL